MAEKVIERVNDEGKPDEMGRWSKVSTQVKDGDKTIPLTYTVPHFSVFLDWASKLPRDAKVAGEGYEGYTQESVYDRFLYAVDLRERAAERESKAAESTVLMINGKPFDLAKMPLAKAIQAVNFAHGFASTVGKEPQRAAVVTRRRLLESKRAKEVAGGFIDIGEGISKEDAAKQEAIPTK